MTLGLALSLDLIWVHLAPCVVHRVVEEVWVWLLRLPLSCEGSVAILTLVLLSCKLVSIVSVDSLVLLCTHAAVQVLSEVGPTEGRCRPIVP